LPVAVVDGDVNGLRFGVNELVRWGLDERDMDRVAEFVAQVLLGNRTPSDVAPDVTAFRRGFNRVHFIRS
jgi:glycine hydroxymethyltransferase